MCVTRIFSIFEKTKKNSAPPAAGTRGVFTTCPFYLARERARRERPVSVRPVTKRGYTRYLNRDGRDRLLAAFCETLARDN